MRLLCLNNKVSTLINILTSRERNYTGVTECCLQAIATEKALKFVCLERSFDIFLHLTSHSLWKYPTEVREYNPK